MLSFRKFLLDNYAPTVTAPQNAGTEVPPPPDLVSLANRAKQELQKTKSMISTPSNAQNPNLVQNQMNQMKQIGNQLTNKAQQYQMQQLDTIANKVLQSTQQSQMR